MLNRQYTEEEEEDEFFELLTNGANQDEYYARLENKKESIWCKIKNICKKIPEPIDTLLVYALLITVGFGIVVGIFAIMHYVENGPLIVGFVLFAIIMGAINAWMDSQW